MVVAAAAAAVVGLLVGRPWRREAPQLAMRIVEQDGWRGDAHPGEQVRAQARVAGAPYFEIRVYRGARELIVRCPDAGPPSCLGEDRAELAWRIPSAGSYQIALLVAQTPIAAPRGSLDDDLAAAGEGGARAVDVRPLRVE